MRHVISFSVGAFTEATSVSLSKMQPDIRAEVMQAYFGKNGSGYTLCRLHMGSCDYCITPYNEDNVTDDFELKSFNIDHDMQTLVPLIQEV